MSKEKSYYFENFDEADQLFDRMWEADQRAIKLWQAETGKRETWPDRTELVRWLLAQWDAARSLAPVTAKPQNLSEKLNAARRAVADIVNSAGDSATMRKIALHDLIGLLDDVVAKVEEQEIAEGPYGRNIHPRK